MSELSRAEWIGFFPHRRDVYRFLARSCQREMDAEWLTKFPVRFRKTGIQEVDEGFQLLRRFLRDWQKDETLVEELADDYANCFLGMGLQPIYPCESVYRSNQNLVFQHPYFEVLESYQAFGLTKSERCREPEDHIGLEFEFMAHLCGRAADAVTRDRPEELRMVLSAQVDFMQSHLKPWVFDWCGHVAERARLGFYKAIGKIAKGFLVNDEQGLSRLAEVFSCEETNQLQG